MEYVPEELKRVYGELRRKYVDAERRLVEQGYDQNLGVGLGIGLTGEPCPSPLPLRMTDARPRVVQKVGWFAVGPGVGFGIGPSRRWGFGYGATWSSVLFVSLVTAGLLHLQVSGTAWRLGRRYLCFHS
jgi:hypothetical protein